MSDIKEELVNCIEFLLKREPTLSNGDLAEVNNLISKARGKHHYESTKFSVTKSGYEHIADWPIEEE